MTAKAKLDKAKPDWAGDDVLSRVVNVLIKTKPIYRVMKAQARRVLIKTAEKSGVPWRENSQVLEQALAQTIKAFAETDSSRTSESLDYPAYYQVPFHAYDEGNLCWQAAFEAPSATYAMALRVWPQEDLSWQAAHNKLRGSFHQVLREHGPQSPVKDILDVGCSVGLSTRSLQAYYEQTQNTPVRTVGLDLSPYMLAVARHQHQHQHQYQRDQDTAESPAKGSATSTIEWLHAKAESTQLPECSFDLVTLQFVIHELPRHITQLIFDEAHRLLRPGGCIAIVDNNPQSSVIQNLPPVLFTLMKSTEPWSDDYYTFNVEAALATSGFETLVTVASDPRHRTLVGHKPSLA
ncbi:MAG: class I SAM-dependent methyltransferase [Cyanobacteria bacterium J06597_16]